MGERLQSLLSWRDPRFVTAASLCDLVLSLYFLNRCHDYILRGYCQLCKCRAYKNIFEPSSVSLSEQGKVLRMSNQSVVCDAGWCIRASAIFITMCLTAAIVLYVTPFQVVAVLLGVYVLRHPRFRDPLPAVPMNFFGRLPSQSDRIL